MLWHWVRLALVAALCAYLLITLTACAWQNKLVYFPTREIERTPADAGLPFEDLTLAASDGVKLNAWFVPARGSARGAVLFCHGNGGNISHRIETLALLRRMGFDVLIFDYRGYGRSEGRLGEKGTYLDAEAAWRYLTETRKAPAERIVIFGRSLGGSVAAKLATEHAPAALVIESSFTSVDDLGAELYPWLPVRLISRFNYATAKNVKLARCPVLVVHSPQDEIIPFKHGQRIFAAANQPKEFLKIRGDHNGGWMTSGELYSNGLERFFKKYLKAN